MAQAKKKATTKVGGQSTQPHQNIIIAAIVVILSAIGFLAYSLYQNHNNKAHADSYTSMGTARSTTSGLVYHAAACKEMVTTPSGPQWKITVLTTISPADPVRAAHAGILLGWKDNPNDGYKNAVTTSDWWANSANSSIFFAGTLTKTATIWVLGVYNPDGKVTFNSGGEPIDLGTLTTSTMRKC